MGTVYRARDTRLNRQVAIKTLSDTYALTPDRVARFEREAQLLAALNHPHIAGIYGAEAPVIEGVWRGLSRVVRSRRKARTAITRCGRGRHGARNCCTFDELRARVPVR
jgi:hypothetical protein